MVNNYSIRPGVGKPRGNDHHVRHVGPAGVDESFRDVAVFVQFSNRVELVFIQPALVVRGDQWGREGRMFKRKRCALAKSQLIGASTLL